MDFEKECMVFTMREPYYGILLSSMARVPTRSVGTLAVARSGNVFQLLYNPDFCARWNLDTMLELLKHEVLHVALGHFTVWGGEDAADDAHTRGLRNVAADLEVNSYLARGRMQREAGGCWPEDYGFRKSLGTREYFRLLLDMEKKKVKEKKNDKGDNDGGSSGAKPQEKPAKDPEDDRKSFDEHDRWPGRDMEEAGAVRQAVEDMLAQAADEVEKGRGTVPAELTVRIGLIRDRRRARPVADWRAFLRRYTGNAFSEETRRSRMRPSRRFPGMPGNVRARKSRVLVAIDTSGSIQMDEYKEFMGQIGTLSRSADFHVVECDAAIHREYDFKGKYPAEVRGGGGTSFQPPVDMFNRERGRYDALIYFTDGYAPIPGDTPRETLWVISSDGDQSGRGRYRVNGASVVFIPEKKTKQ